MLGRFTSRQAAVAVAEPEAAPVIESPAFELPIPEIVTEAPQENNPQLKSKLLLAALAGLGRIDDGGQARLANQLGLELEAENVWTRALEQAVQSRQPGTVALLAGVGMQTGGWRGVPPEHLYRIVSALRDIGLDYYARMIAAEALARL